MQFNEVFEAFKKLTPAEQNRLIDAGRKLIQFNNATLRSGAKVQFKTKHGVFIAGTFIRMKRKNAEVLSLYGSEGIKRGHAGNWSVSPELLIPIPSDQVGMYEFP
jgi:hypothetical protein